LQYLSAMQQRTLVFKQPIVRDPTASKDQGIGLAIGLEF